MWRPSTSDVIAARSAIAGTRLYGEMLFRPLRLRASPPWHSALLDLAMRQAKRKRGSSLTAIEKAKQLAISCDKALQAFGAKACEYWFGDFARVRRLP